MTKPKKIRKHLSIEEQIYLVAEASGSVSKFFNEAAKHFIESKEFKSYIDKQKEKTND